MLQFLHPTWLWAISGIIIPLIIHLWNIKQGKVLKVGSIAFLQNSSKQYAKSFKVNEWLLLLLRCLLVILASFLLAAPTWKKSSTNKEKGWLLIDKKGFNTAYKTYKPVIDSLIKKGFSFHYIDNDFTIATLAEALKDTISIPTTQPINYWDLVSELDKKINGSLPIYLITDNQLKHFAGNRPNVKSNINWLTYLQEDSIEKHIAKAYLTSDDSIRLIVSNSTPISNSFLFESLSTKTQVANDYKTSVENGNAYTTYKNDPAFLVDTSILKITIYAVQNSDDASYLKAGLKAIQSFTKRKLQLLVIKDVQSIPANQDWLFWLSDQQLPTTIAAKNIFAYAGGKEENTSSWINSYASNVDNNAVKLSKRTESATVSVSTQLIWKDGFGNPILTKENNNATIYRFYSRLDPAWNNLVWDNSFATLLASIVLNEDQITSVDDKRIIDVQQLQPFLKTSSNKSITQLDENNTDISNLFWISVFIVFLIERLVSFRTKKVDA